MSVIPGGFTFNAHGENLFLDRNNLTVARLSGAGRESTGYVFTNRPFKTGENLIIRIHAVKQQSKSVFGLGVTSCNPDRLDVRRLPEDCDLLSDRPEYWVIEKAHFTDLIPGDELHFRFTENASGDGEVKFSKNDMKPVSVMFVDKTVALWAFFELGNVTEMKIMDPSARHTFPSGLFNYVDTDLLRTLTQNTPSNASSNHQSLPTSVSAAQILPAKSRKPAPPIPPRPLVVKAKTGQPTPTPIVAPNPKEIAKLADKLSQSKVSQSTSKSSNNTLRKAGNQIKNVAPPPPTKPRDPAQVTSSADECLVCMEREVDCVLYTCGHMCLCHACASDLKTRTNATCPICRKEIADVIKTFKA